MRNNFQHVCNAIRRFYLTFPNDHYAPAKLTERFVLLSITPDVSL
jgi:hypothetical protein